MAPVPGPADGPVYAGIGARATPPEVLAGMRQLAERMVRAGWTLRSGGARGADAAFEAGAEAAGRGPWSEIYHPGYPIPDRAFEIAAEAHPRWSACSPWARRLLARNVQVVLGASLDRPADLVLYWRPLGTTRGGTSHALRVADVAGVPAVHVAELPLAWALHPVGLPPVATAG